MTSSRFPPARRTPRGYVSTATTFTAGQARTLLIADQLLFATPPITIVTGDDYD